VKNVHINVEEKCNLTIIMDEWDQKWGIIMMYRQMFHFDCMCAMEAKTLIEVIYFTSLDFSWWMKYLKWNQLVQLFANLNKKNETWHFDCMCAMEAKTLIKVIYLTSLHFSWWMKYLKWNQLVKLFANLNKKNETWCHVIYLMHEDTWRIWILGISKNSS
jgi:hypothetical protein